MEATKNRNIRNGEQYTHLFPKAEGNTATIRKNANVSHTVAFIPKVVNETLDHTKQIAERLKGDSVYDTCSNIWHFVYQHIRYRKDQEGYEQIRSPARAWHDRFNGVDCDCYTVFISSILTNLGIPHILRITKYHRDYFQHIYPVVPDGSKTITIDCVTDKFDYEVPYSEKKDYPMDLQYLNGFDGDGLAELGKIVQKRFSSSKRISPKAKGLAAKKASAIVTKSKSKAATRKANKAAKKAAANAPGAPKKVKGFKKVLNKINKINPATVLLRNGVLASMKLNIKNVAARLRWSYLTPEQAVAKGINPEKYQKLVATRQKLENIFYKAGGKPDNLKKAILKGKGNKDKAVNGLDGFDGLVEYMNYSTPLNQLLGRDVYFSENVEGMEGFEGLGELGEPLTLTSIAAAAGVIAGIVGALKQIGDIFQKKTKGSEDFDEAKNEQAEKEPTPKVDEAAPALPPIKNSNADDSSSYTPEPITQPYKAPAITESSSMPDYSPATEKSLVRTQAKQTAPTDTDDNIAEENSDLPAVAERKTVARAATTTTATSDTDPPPKETFWDKNKSWLKPVAIGVGGIGIIAIGMKLLKTNQPPARASSASKSLNGVSRGRKNHKRKTKHKQKQKYSRKKAVALL